MPLDEAMSRYSLHSFLQGPVRNGTEIVGSLLLFVSKVRARGRRDYQFGFRDRPWKF